MMPLYLDYHFIPGVSLEEAKKADSLDLAVQNKYNVKYHQFWINEAEQKFLERLFPIIEGCSSNFDFGVESLSSQIGVSLPLLYRKVQELAGVSAESFIRDFKMSKALYLLNQKQKNISEVALEVGINNPTYFSKCFQDKYGITPSRITA